MDLGEAYRATGDPARAAQAFEQALARSPESLVIQLKLANALIETRQWAKAEAASRRATLKAPSDPLAWGLLGWALWQQDQRRPSQSRARESRPPRPRFPRTPQLPRIAPPRHRRSTRRRSRLSRSRSHHARHRRMAHQPGPPPGIPGRGIRSRKPRQSGRPIRPNLAPAHELWGALALNRGDFDTAIRELQTAIKLNPPFPKAEYELGLALYSKGDTQAAIPAPPTSRKTRLPRSQPIPPKTHEITQALSSFVFSALPLRPLRLRVEHSSPSLTQNPPKPDLVLYPIARSIRPIRTCSITHP